MNCALLDSLIDDRNRRSEARLSRFGVAFSDCLAQSTQRCAQSGLVCAVYERTFFGLTGAFQRRKMVCHALLCSFKGALNCLIGWDLARKHLILTRVSIVPSNLRRLNIHDFEALERSFGALQRTS